MLLGAVAMAATSTPPPSALEVWAWIAGVVIGLGAIAGALTAIFAFVKAAWRIFWHGVIPWLVRAIRLVDALTDMPEKVATLGTEVAALSKVTTDHIIVADEKAIALTALDAKVSLILGEVKNNGGSSSKDSLHRIEGALGLPTPPYTPAPPCTGPIPIPDPQETS